MVNAAMVTAVSASISTPVLPMSLAVAVISTAGSDSSKANSTATAVNISGWHRGIRAEVPFAPRMPATPATARFDYLAVPRALEGLAAEHAATNATDADRVVIDNAFRRMEEAAAKRNPDQEAALDAEFHMTIVEAAHNVVMLHMLRSLYDLLVRGVFYNRNVIYSLPERRSKLLDQHRAIRDAVVGRDAAAARAAVEVHMDFIAEALRDANRMRSREQVAALRQRHEELRARKPRSRKAGG